LTFLCVSRTYWRVCAYRGGYSAADRRAVEGALFAGDLRGREVKGRVRVSGYGRSWAVKGG